MKCLVEVGALELVKVLRDVECGRILGKVLRVSLVMCYNVVGESYSYSILVSSLVWADSLKGSLP